MMLKDRKEAGEKLAHLLGKYVNKSVLVLACSRSAVETASHTARYLNAEFSLIISSKLSYPGHDQYFFGALCEGDKLYVDSARHLLTDSLICKIVEKQKRLIHESVSLYRNGRCLPDMEGRTVILIDDALIHGFEFIPAIRFCQAQKAARIVVAAAVGNIIFDKHVTEADELNIAHQYDSLSDPNEVYELHQPLTDIEIKKLLCRED